MSVGTSFGGLVGVLSGSGSATGSATFGTGASASAYLGVGYHTLSSGTGWTWPAGVSFSVISPYATYTSFKPKSVNINIELVATQDFIVGYTYAGYNYVTADFSVALTGNANYACTLSSSSANPSITLSATSATSSTRRALSEGSDVLELSPGDVVTLSVQYDNFNIGERTELFVSAHSDDDSSETGSSILQVPFTVNGAGSGSFDVEWVVPWDTRFLQTSSLLHSLSVHASNQMSVRYFAPQKLQLTADPLVHGMVTAPASDEVVAVNTTYVVVWDSDGLITFKRSVAGTSGLGALELVPFVNIELYYEDLDASGATVLATHVRLNTAPEPNDRSAYVTFPSHVLDGISAGCTRRFFVVVASTEVANLMGWSKGYFHLVLPSASNPTVAVSEAKISQAVTSMSLVGPKGLHKTSHQFRRPLGAPQIPAQQLVRAVPLSSTPTPMASCSTSSQVTYGSSVEGSFQAVTLVGIKFSISGVSAEYTLLKSSYCVPKPTVEEGDPTSDSSDSQKGLSNAWVAGISVISTIIVLLVSAWLYMRFYARGSVEQALAPAPEKLVNNTVDSSAASLPAGTINPLAVAEV